MNKIECKHKISQEWAENKHLDDEFKELENSLRINNIKAPSIEFGKYTRCKDVKARRF